ncbi:MAG: hypothetical protein LQ352_004170 [Teloschistes flavicans]|nr:MAG: hypothetical protein LQ352_004170 [Teloschistes flavicans]
MPPLIEVSSLPGHMVSVSRPKSSPSTFGPNVEDLLFPENPFRLKSDDYMPSMYSMAPLQTNKAPTAPLYGGDFGLTTATMSPVRAGPVPIAPDPIGLRQMNALKRMREEEDYSEFNQKRRKRAPSQTGPVELNEEEQLLLKLKEEENLPWKDIAVRFQTDLGKSYQVPALQMRFKRLRERMRTWTETDVQALEQAYDYWEKFQFDIIAAKVSKPEPVQAKQEEPNGVRRCWTSAHPSDGRPNTVLASGKRYTPGEYHFPHSQPSSRTHGTPNIAARWNH